MSQEVIITDINRINSLSGYTKTDVLREYHKWLEKSRKEDKKKIDRDEHKKYRFLYYKRHGETYSQTHYRKQRLEQYEIRDRKMP